MHPRLHDALVLCESARGELLLLLSALSHRDWSRRAGRDAWTVAEVFDHLLKAEIGTSKMARRLIRGDYASTVRPPLVELYDSTLAVYPYGRYPAPPGLVPGLLPQEDAAARFAAAHARFIEELSRFDGPDPDALVSEDPDTGMWFTLAGWVRLQGLHEAHHLKQIRSLLEKP